MLNSRFEVRKAAALQFRRTIDVAGYCIVDHHVMWCLSESKLTARSRTRSACPLFSEKFCDERKNWCHSVKKYYVQLYKLPRCYLDVTSTLPRSYPRCKIKPSSHSSPQPTALRSTSHQTTFDCTVAGTALDCISLLRSP